MMVEVGVPRKKKKKKKDRMEDTVPKFVDLALKNNSYDVLIEICENEELNRLVGLRRLLLLLS